ncbi:MAG: type IV toxin-antitoxin system AbiEi family antitoxin [Coriobacteriia bacterium]|nr:type IV toxin-antitoxin system AbiEi family antitoxin [Coriobacteriia bacterium]
MPEEDIAGFVDELQASGRYTFSLQDLRLSRSSSDTALRAALRRLRQRGRIVAPRRGFYVIVPVEYRKAGAPPPSWFIDDLMRFLGQPYYVALLSAAALHGASHQQPMVFQVITDRPTRQGAAGRARIEFHMSASVDHTPVEPRQTETGAMLVSTVESTAFDLVRFPAACGGWSSVATVLQELAEEFDPDKIHEVARERKTPDIQRLGYVLDKAGHPRLADPLLRVLASRRYRPIPLATDQTSVDRPPVRPWRVIPNIELEFDL